MKKLFYFPIVHNQTDLGTLGNTLSLEGGRKYGASDWQNHLRQVEKSWKKVESEITRQVKKISPEKIKIYQDGLPVVDEIGKKIIKDVAQKGSINYSIIDALLTQGAKLEIAENKEYLLKEYYLLSDIALAETPENTLKAYLKHKYASEELLNDRDNFIANQINVTLKNGETGIAFFGAAHSITNKLNKDIKVVVIQMFTDNISLNLSNQ